MKKTLIALFIILFSGCGEAEKKTDEKIQPKDYDISTEDSSTSNGGDLVVSDNEQENENEQALNECRDKNAEISMKLTESSKKIVECQKEIVLIKKENQKNNGLKIKPSHLELIKKSIINTKQPEYKFTCGRVAKYIKESWFSLFETRLINEKIHFANGFLEVEDLFSACKSETGKVFFLGASREDENKFFIIKYDIKEKFLEQAMMFDELENEIVKTLGKREGPYIAFKSETGKEILYYYDANIVVAK